MSHGKVGIGCCGLDNFCYPVVSALGAFVPRFSIFEPQRKKKKSRDNIVSQAYRWLTSVKKEELLNPTAVIRSFELA